MHASSSSSPFSSSLENKPPDGALVAKVDEFLGGLRGLEAREKVIVMGFNEFVAFKEVFMDAVVSPELCFEGKWTVPCSDGGQDVRASLGGLPGAAGGLGAAVGERGEVGIFVGSSKSRIAAW